MFKFNNNHIFTGYLKQLLASFNLPKCRVYTKELAEHQPKQETARAELTHREAKKAELADMLKANLEEITKESDTEKLTELKKTRVKKLAEYHTVLTHINKLNELLTNLSGVISTTYHSEYQVYPNTIPEDLQLPLMYPSTMRYAPYIKDGYLQVYSNEKWHHCHESFKDDTNKHQAFHKAINAPYATIPYTYGQKILNYTKNLQIQNTVYDSYTHEYLGDYLRFHRDFANINLMPLYNCFSNRACPHLDISFTIGNSYEVKFKTDQSFETALYKYYMVPVKFFKNYTIAIDSGASIEVCCCIYDEYHNKDADFSTIPQLTYQCFGDMQFKTPVLYTKLQNINSLLLNPTNTANDLCQQEDNLKLILKVPVNNKSSIVILEGDYTKYNDSIARAAVTEMKETLPNGNTRIKHVIHSMLMKHNKTVVNYEYPASCEYLADKLITPLQLLRTNTGESYPFADRLVEYLVGNAVTHQDEIQDNVVRAKKVISANCEPNVYPIVAEDGIWEPILQCLVYDYINEKQNVHDINHDILGFIDKDVEKWYAATNKGSTETIANIDIYNN